MSTVDAMTDRLMRPVECGWLPDPAIRWGIRRLCAERLRSERRKRGEQPQRAAIERFVATLRGDAIAPVPDKANAQHYAVPAELFELMLGRRLKYSCCWWDETTPDLDAAEEASLALTAAHANLHDGLDILDLGCGWGSLSLWMAERYPRSRIVGVSNSHSQRRFIEARARERGLANLSIVTADMNAFAIDRRFDRVVSVEMFEHMRNYHALLQRVAAWLRPGGQLFVHVFCHRELAYLFQEQGAGNWMGRHFFSGGLMPSADLLPSVESPFVLDEAWQWDGRHYARTARAWLDHLDERRSATLAVLGQAYGDGEARRWLGRWRIFLMACEELFGYADGAEWGVAHYRFSTAGTGAVSDGGGA
jgi:cyclopropane-fatty-acyl-phospholipid synthase